MKNEIYISFVNSKKFLFKFRIFNEYENKIQNNIIINFFIYY